MTEAFDPMKGGVVRIVIIFRAVDGGAAQIKDLTVFDEEIHILESYFEGVFVAAVSQIPQHPPVQAVFRYHQRQKIAVSCAGFIKNAAGDGIIFLGGRIVFD